MICIFARQITDELASLVTQIDSLVDRSQAHKLAAFVVLLADDPSSAEANSKSISERYKIKHVPLTVFKGAEGPADYALAKEADVTVMMWGGEKKLVRVNHTFGKGKLDKSFIAKVVADASMDDDHRNSAAVRFFNSRISIDQLKQLGRRVDIESLDLQDANVTAAGLKNLKGLIQLRSLNLFRNKQLDDSAIDTLISFTRLRELNISSTQITNDGLTQLAKHLTQLTTLNIRNSRMIDDSGLETLHQLPKLQALLCGNTSITDAGLMHVAKLSSLRELEIRKTKIRNAGLAHIANLTELRKLNCSDNNLTSDGLQHLSGLTELRSLDLSQTRINDASLAYLYKLTHLAQLDLSKTRLTGEGLHHLYRLQNLRFINLFETRIEDSSIAGLKKALPNCEIVR